MIDIIVKLAKLRRLLGRFKFYVLLRSTKWNASLILLCDYAELVSLCKVIVWKTHIPVRTQKWPPLLIFAGARHGIVINHVTA